MNPKDLPTAEIDIRGNFLNVVFPPEDGERYMLLEPLGQGGMATVYRAKDTRTGKVVAVKIPHAELPLEGVDRFNREMQLMSRAPAHPNIITVLDGGLEEEEGVNRPFFVMEYVPGSRSLESLIERCQARQRGLIRGSLVPINVFYAIMEQLLSALQALHEEHFIHRDLKPENVLYTEGKDGIWIKLTDLGISRVLTSDPKLGSRLTAEYSIVGSPAYISPECVLFSEADFRSDLYAVGAIAYELVTGKMVVTGETPPEVLQNIISHPSERYVILPERYPSRMVEGMNPVLESAILALLERNPTQRLQTAAEAMERFYEAEQWEIDRVSRPVLPPLPAASSIRKLSTRPPTPPLPDRQDRPVRRGFVPALLSLIGAALLVLAALRPEEAHDLLVRAQIMFPGPAADSAAPDVSAPPSVPASASASVLVKSVSFTSSPAPKLAAHEKTTLDNATAILKHLPPKALCPAWVKLQVLRLVNTRNRNQQPPVTAAYCLLAQCAEREKGETAAAKLYRAQCESGSPLAPP